MPYDLSDAAAQRLQDYIDNLGKIMGILAHIARNG